MSRTHTTPPPPYEKKKSKNQSNTHVTFARTGYHLALPELEKVLLPTVMVLQGDGEVDLLPLRPTGRLHHHQRGCHEEERRTKIVGGEVSG